MSGSLITLPLRLSLRTAASVLRTARDAADTGLGLLEMIGEVLDPGGSEAVAPAPVRFADEPAPSSDNGHGAPPYEVVSEPVAPEDPLVLVDPVEPVEPVHIDAEPEIVEEFAEPGAEDGAGAEVHVRAPLDGYDALRAADLVARVRGADAALLGAIELYEQAHRKRRTVLDAVAREQRRPR